MIDGIESTESSSEADIPTEDTEVKSAETQSSESSEESTGKPAVETTPVATEPEEVVEDKEEPAVAEEKEKTKDVETPPDVTEVVEASKLATPTPAPDQIVDIPPAGDPIDPNTIQQITDDVTTTVSTPAVVSTPPPPVVTTEFDGLIQQLQLRIDAFVKANTAFGTKPEHFNTSAKAALSITNFIIQYPKRPIMDVLLTFFKDNINGVAHTNNLLKGSTTLSRVEEQRVGYLFTLFHDLAIGGTSRIDSGKVTQVLKRPEIADFCSKRLAGMRQKR